MTRMTRRCRAAVIRYAKRKRDAGASDKEVREACEWYLRARGFRKPEARAAVEELGLWPQGED